MANSKLFKEVSGSKFWKILNKQDVAGRRTEVNGVMKWVTGPSKEQIGLTITDVGRVSHFLREDLV